MSTRDLRSVIKATLECALPDYWDGQMCVRELKKANFHWRQMEWIGWWFEYRGRRLLIEKLGGADGPSFGNTGFDYSVNDQVWDLKASAGTGKWQILNDIEAIRRCCEEYGDVGFIIACGTAVFDDPARRCFQRWHDSLKGSPSAYVRRRVARGATSRLRKKAFRLDKYVVFRLRNRDIDRGLNEGWLGRFQEGMRNADGSSRRAKLKIVLSDLPNEFIT